MELGKAPDNAVVFQNGVFHVLANRLRQRDAVAVYRGRILYAGEREKAMDAFPQGVNPEVVDLEGKTVVPGFIDSHLHLVSLGMSLRNLSLSGVRSIRELQERVSRHASRLAQDEWVVGRGWDQDLLDEKRFPTRKDLDEAGSGRPVYLTRSCGHLAVLSSRALEVVGISRETPDPPGGQIDRDAYGDPTGILREAALGIASAKIPGPERSSLAEMTAEAMKHLLSLGITSVHANDGSRRLEDMPAIYRSAHVGGAPLRIYWDLPYSLLPELAATPLRTGDGDDYVRIGAVKIMADGSLGGRTAALEKPYADDRSTSGILVTPPDRLREAVYTCHALGMQVAIHAIGDRAVRVALEAIGHAQSRIVRSPLRHRVVHAQILSPLLMSEMKRARAIADIQPKFITTDRHWALQRVGPERIRSSYAWRTMQRSGLMLAGGSDCPVEPANPCYGIYAAVTRQDLDGEPSGGFYPNERVSVEDAIRMFTMGGAYGSFQENIKGTLEPGKLADFVVLSDDIFQISPDEIKDLEVLRTVVGGETVYQKT